MSLYDTLKHEQVGMLSATLNSNNRHAEIASCGRYNIINIFCREIDNKTGGRFQKDVEISGKDASGYLVHLMSELLSNINMNSRRIGMKYINDGIKQMYFTDEFMETSATQSSYWIDICSAVNKKYNLWDKTSFISFRKQLAEFLQHVNPARTIPYYSRSLQDIAAYFTIYLCKDSTYYLKVNNNKEVDGLYYRLKKAYASAANNATSGNGESWTYTDAITNDIDEILDDYRVVNDSDNLEEITERLIEHVKDNRESFSVATYATVTKEIANELAKLPYQDRPSKIFKEAVDRKNYEILEIYIALQEIEKKMNEQTEEEKEQVEKEKLKEDTNFPEFAEQRAAMNRRKKLFSYVMNEKATTASDKKRQSLLIKKILDGRAEFIVSRMEKYCVIKGIMVEDKSKTTFEEKLANLKNKILKGKKINYSKMQLSFVETAVEYYHDIATTLDDEGKRCVAKFYNFNKKYTVVTALREIYIVALMEKYAWRSDQKETINAKLTALGLKTIHDITESEDEMTPSMCYDYAAIYHMGKQVRNSGRK